ncbi:MAG: PDZ domain-containing protein [Chitinophagaceae bacterium]|nr:PDZ domain-containing protein [Chitinophagaceae bacterium]
MKRWLLSLFFLSFSLFSDAQDFSKSMHHAFLVTRMAEKFHIQPAVLNDEFSNRLLHQFLKKTDKERIIFHTEDIQQFFTYQNLLDDEIIGRKTNFLQVVYNLRQKRLKENDSLLQIILKTPFNFLLQEKITKAEDTSYATSVATKQTKLYKYLKWQVLDAVVEGMPDSLTSAQQKKYVDSASAILIKFYKTSFQKAKDKTTPEQLGNLFCNSIALCYDPHSTFFTAKEKESFDEELGQTPLRFGFNLDADENGSATIDKLLPGGPAFKSGAFNAGDKIISIQEPGKQPVNVAEMSLQQLNSVMEEATSDKLIFTIKKPDGTTRGVTLFKERVEAEEDEDDLVQGYILKGSKNIGYISIPDFYVDWEDTETGVNGCANDVAKEIIKLNKENIHGLIIDLRYNGGGSLQEAIDLSGIFIDGGPVGQYKNKDAKIYSLKDVNSGSIFTGPLLIMVNGYSASASEFFAAAMQDYNRALIVGAPTYGKSTGQLVLPLDTTITLESADTKTAEAYVKLTTSALYRITGKTAQKNGVLPDVPVNDLLQNIAEKEKDEDYSFTLLPIEANKYYKPFPALSKEKLIHTTKTITDTSMYFQQMKAFEQWSTTILQQPEFSLKLEDMLRYKRKEQQFYTYFENYKSNSSFTVQNHQLRKQRLQASEMLTESDGETRALIADDPYISLCFELMLQMINR